MEHVQVPTIYTAKEWTIQSLIDWLASFGLTNEGGVTRLLYTKSWEQAQQAMQTQMKQAGLETYTDQVGNVFGRVSGTKQADKVILTGSHIDTVVQGGKYDGAYGVVASLLAVQRLVAAYGPPKKTIEVVSLCEEEGSRFPLTYWGSKNVMGEYDEKAIATIVDQDGVTFRDAMEQAGYSLADYAPNKRDNIEHFVELHIEQGPILQAERHDIGMVSHIVGQQRFTITFYGQCNHAGTTEMRGRKDAMVCAANAITLLTALAHEKYPPKLRATMGQLQAYPNVPNVIAGEVSFTLDIRHHEQRVIDDFVAELYGILQSIDERYEVTHKIERWTAVNPVKLDESIKQIVYQLAATRNLQMMDMVSGAGHDAQVFGQHVPTTLLFVPSRDGISHSPLEFTSIHYLEQGVQLLQDVLYHLAYEGMDEQ